MNFQEAKTFVVQRLTTRYGNGESESIARIALEDTFQWRVGDWQRRLSEVEMAQLSTVVARLEQGEPLQYVLGMADFFGLKFHVSPAVLIPRQETEELVALVLEHLKTIPETTPAVLDIGLGSGCIGITLLKKRNHIRLFGIEKSPDALAVAQQNANAILGENARLADFQSGDILMSDALPTDWPLFHVVVSNPPYIPLAEKHLVPEHVQAHEPSLALFVEDHDPLLFYRQIASLALTQLFPGGALFFECNQYNAQEAAALLQEMGFKHVQLIQDLSGADRILRAFSPG
jgi:release factor glutamine methyltransferase